MTKPNKKTFYSKRAPIAEVVKMFYVDHNNLSYICLYRYYKDNIPVTQIIKPEGYGEIKRQIGHLNESDIIKVIDLWHLL